MVQGLGIVCHIYPVEVEVVEHLAPPELRVDLVQQEQAELRVDLVQQEQAELRVDLVQQEQAEQVEHQ
jgi:hypothetical protein